MISLIKKRYAGGAKYYREALAVAVPMMIQNFITSFVNMLDNIMVGQLGTAQMSGVSITNQIMFVMNLCLFGAMSGAGIFTAQFAGSRDHQGIRHTFRFKLMTGTLIGVLGIAIFGVFGETLIKTFLQGEGSAEDAAVYLKYGKEYLAVMLIGILPFALTNVYASTLRELGKTTVPMIAGIAAILVNLVFNYILIFGHFGFPELGVAGAAVATVMSRFVELGIVAVWTHTHTDDVPFAKGLYKSLKVPMKLVKRITGKAIPLIINETLFSLGVTMVTQCYSLRGLDVMAAINISNTLNQLMQVSSFALGNAVGILTGQKLGAGLDREELIYSNKKLISFAVDISVVCSLAMIAISGLFPKLYNTTDSVRTLAVSVIIITAIFTPARSYTHAAYFTIRSGGKTFITMIFDCCFIWCVMVPLATVLAKFTGLPIVPLYFVCQAVEVIKCVIGAIMVKKGIWINNIIS